MHCTHKKIPTFIDLNVIENTSLNGTSGAETYQYCCELIAKPQWLHIAREFLH